ncbi:MAG TPA: YiiD C-terminal domain-containing protein [Gammaproteobacteria bacterium]|nr:YiiD C-terminal domain-containing protein [Gammaproteobacteria bacterium]
MQAADLEAYLHEQIPLSSAMRVRVVSVEQNGVVLAAPLEPNTNHRGTVFGGSASALAILAAWAILHARCRDEGIAARLVIRRNTMEYERPMVGEFTARARLESNEQWQTFAHTLARKRKARITIVATVEHRGEAAARFTGEFVAIG